MKPNRVICLAALGCLLAFSQLSADGLSSLEERMTAREFRQAGLHKLSEEELAFLNDWIRLRSLAEGEMPDWAIAQRLRPDDRATAGAGSLDRRGFPDGERTEIRSHLRGSFSGWRGSAVFELDNGMVWQQAEPGSFAVPAMESPEVRIRPGPFGSWQLQVSEYNTLLRVRRVE